jgi:TolB-like protein/Flp pilus assembly protein TadD
VEALDLQRIPALGAALLVTEPSHAVFLSYASQDAEAAQKIAEALRAGGIEVFLDQSELRGGDAWDRRIREQIHDCRLFIAVISAHTEERDEGYFRREWKLAVDRTHDMAEKRAFLVPVVVDGTSERGASVPDKFRELQWTRLPGGETPPAFVERVRRLLSPEPSSAVRAPAKAQSGAVGVIRAPAQSAWSPKRGVLVSIGLVVLGAVGYFAIEKFWMAKPAAPSPTVAASAAPAANPAPAAFSPPPHSIAVLPFVNMSGDKDQQYFSDGLTEEVLNSLAEINELQVAARTSSFSFKDKDVDVATIAHKLNVASVLEGSVRRSGHTVRITAQLINAVTGFHLWSKTYDRDLSDVLKLQTEIATAVAGALKVTLLGDDAAKIELGGTRNPAAFDAYLRGRKAQLAAHGEEDYQTAIAAFTEAIALDANYALAFANRSLAFSGASALATSVSAIREDYDKALIDARKAVALTPNLAEGHVALAVYFENGGLDFSQANEEYERALALAPGNARVLQNSGIFAVLMGRAEAGIAAARRAVVLDPLSPVTHRTLGESLFLGRQYPEALAPLEDALALNPDDLEAYGFHALVNYALGDVERARTSCESKPDYWFTQQCLAITYYKLGRHADAEVELAKIKAAFGDANAYEYATVYAQWGDTAKALEWLETAMRVRDPGLAWLKTDPLMDPVRNEPRFEAIERELKFPE